MDEVGITGAVLSVSLPHWNFLDPPRGITLSRAINDFAADLKRRHPERFGAYAVLPLPDVTASLAELTHALGAGAVAPADAMQALARFYYDTALSVAPEQIAALHALAPMSQILYGTDFPFANEARLRMAEQAFRSLSFTAQEAQMVRHGNAAHLFGDFAARCRGVD